MTPEADCTLKKNGGQQVPALARWLLALGIVATLAANMAQGWSHGPVGAVIAAWPAVSLVGSYELSLGVPRLLHDVALNASRRASATPPPCVALVVVAAQRPALREPATCATPLTVVGDELTSL